MLILKQFQPIADDDDVSTVTFNMACKKFTGATIDMLINLWHNKPALWNTYRLTIYSNVDTREVMMTINNQLNMDMSM